MADRELGSWQVTSNVCPAQQHGQQKRDLQYRFLVSWGLNSLFYSKICLIFLDILWYLFHEENLTSVFTCILTGMLCMPVCKPSPLCKEVIVQCNYWSSLQLCVLVSLSCLLP